MVEDRRRRPATTEHNYLKKLLEAQMDATPGTVQTAEVRHDDWCDIFRKGFCNCDPVIALRRTT